MPTDRQYTISISEISPDGMTVCSTWLVGGSTGRQVQRLLKARFGDAPTQQMFSADAINLAAQTIPLVEM